MTCRHCGILSSPQNKSRMSLEDARRYILEAAAIPQFRKVTFTGGEPMVCPDEHMELIALCREHGSATRMVTNGFWARTMDQGLQALEALKNAGLDELNLSADKFHLEFQDARVFRNALECARRLGFARIVSFVTNSYNEMPLDTFSRMYGVPREDLLDLQPLMSDLARMEAIKDEKIFVFAGGLIGLGRAADYPEELSYFPLSVFPSNGCPEVINKPVIYPDGDFQACCCAGGKIAAFTVGNLKHHSLRELYEKMFARSHYRFINSYGPRELYDAIASAMPERPRSERYTSICELCVRATEGLKGDEVDAIVDAASLKHMLEALGVEVEVEQAKRRSPSHPVIALRVIS